MKKTTAKTTTTKTATPTVAGPGTQDRLRLLAVLHGASELAGEMLADISERLHDHCYDAKRPRWAMGGRKLNRPVRAALEGAIAALDAAYLIVYREKPPAAAILSACNSFVEEFGATDAVAEDGYDAGAGYLAALIEFARDKLRQWPQHHADQPELNRLADTITEHLNEFTEVTCGDDSDDPDAWGRASENITNNVWGNIFVG